jgi:hypothetical protein
VVEIYFISETRGASVKKSGVREGAPACFTDCRRPCDTVIDAKAFDCRYILVLLSGRKEPEESSRRRRRIAQILFSQIYT